MVTSIFEYSTSIDCKTSKWLVVASPCSCRGESLLTKPLKLRSSAFVYFQMKRLFKMKARKPQWFISRELWQFPFLDWSTLFSGEEECRFGGDGTKVSLSPKMLSDGAMALQLLVIVSVFSLYALCWALWLFILHFFVSLALLTNGTCGYTVCGLGYRLRIFF